MAPFPLPSGQADNRSRAVFFPGPAILADRDDRNGLAVNDGGEAATGVIGPVGGHRFEIFPLVEQVEQFRQGGTAALRRSRRCSPPYPAAARRRDARTAAARASPRVARHRPGMPLKLSMKAFRWGLPWSM